MPLNRRETKFGCAIEQICGEIISPHYKRGGLSSVGGFSSGIERQRISENTDGLRLFNNNLSHAELVGLSAGYSNLKQKGAARQQSYLTQHSSHIGEGSLGQEDCKHQEESRTPDTYSAEKDSATIFGPTKNPRARVLKKERKIQGVQLNLKTPDLREINQKEIENNKNHLKKLSGLFHVPDVLSQ